MAIPLRVKRIVAIENQQLTDYEGNYEFYKNEQKVMNDKLQSVKSKKVQAVQQKSEQNKLNSEEKKKFKIATELEKKIEMLEEKISKINQEIEENKVNYEKVNNLYYKRVKIESDRDNLLEQWCQMQAG